jgi:hypothetical protein
MKRLPSAALHQGRSPNFTFTPRDFCRLMLASAPYQQIHGNDAARWFRQHLKDNANRLILARRPGRKTSVRLQNRQHIL